MRALVELRAEWPDPVVEFRRPQCSWSGQWWGGKAGKMSHPKSDGSGGDGQAASAIAGPESRGNHAFHLGRLMTFHWRNIAHFAECSNRSSVGFGGRRHFLGAALGALLMMVGVSFLCAQSDSTGALGGTITCAEGSRAGRHGRAHEQRDESDSHHDFGGKRKLSLLVACPRHVPCELFRARIQDLASPVDSRQRFGRSHPGRKPGTRRPPGEGGVQLPLEPVGLVVRYPGGS